MKTYISLSETMYQLFSIILGLTLIFLMFFYALIIRLKDKGKSNAIFKEACEDLLDLLGDQVLPLIIITLIAIPIIWFYHKLFVRFPEYSTLIYLSPFLILLFLSVIVLIIFYSSSRKKYVRKSKEEEEKNV